MQATSKVSDSHKPTRSNMSVSGLNTPIRVGFDLDGVLFYNPLRFVRKPIELVKKHILHKDTQKFYVPKTKIEKALWKLIHMSSVNPATGWEMIRKMKEDGLIEPYLITARFACLENDFIRCLDRIEANQYFAGTFHNAQDEQPHLFKERMIKSLGIEFFVEDNWNIVDHLNKNTDAKVLWISNFMDNDIEFSNRYNSLLEALQKLPSHLNSKS